MNFNNIETRISQLYSSIDIHSELFSKKPKPIQEEFINEDGKRCCTISIGNNVTTAADEVKAYSQMINIIHNLANFKDNLKKSLINPKSKIVEDHINHSLELGIIMDLSNQDKHGYPLERSNRTNLNPTIENIRSSWNVTIPFLKIFHNPMHDNSVIDAEIKDDNGNLIMYFTELVEKATLKWEDFILTYLPNNSSEIETKRNEKKLFEQEKNKLQNLINESYNLIENTEWKPLQKNEIRQGMIVVVGEKGKFDDMARGLVTDIKFEDNKIIIFLLTDHPSFYIQSFDLEKKDFKLIDLKNPNDIMSLRQYYQEFSKKYNEIITQIYY